MPTFEVFPTSSADALLIPVDNGRHVALFDIYSIADRQFGVDRRDQARQHATSSQIYEWVKQGRLLKPAPKVYVIPFAKRSWDLRVRVAAWSFPRAVLSGAAAARWWGLKSFADSAAVSLVAPWSTRSRPTTEPTTFSRHPIKVVRLKGLRVTTIERTLIDLAFSNPAKIEHAVGDAFHMRLTTVDAVSAELDRVPASHNGFDRMYAVMQKLTRTDEKLRSHFEVNVLRKMLAAGLPMPEADYPVRHKGGEYFADFYWPESGIVVEVNGGHHLHLEQVKHDWLRTNVFASRRMTIMIYGEGTDPSVFFDQLRNALSLAIA